MEAESSESVAELDIVVDVQELDAMSAMYLWRGECLKVGEEREIER